MDALYKDCYQMYENDMKILEVNSEVIVNQEDPQKMLNDMKEKALEKVCFVPKIISSCSCLFAYP